MNGRLRREFIEPQERPIIERAYRAPRNVPRGPSHPVEQKIKTQAFMTYTPSAQDPTDPSGIVTSSMLKGYNADIVLAEVASRAQGLDGDTIDNGTSVYFEGWNAIAFFSCFDQVILGTHLQPVEHVQYIRAMSPTPMEVYVGFANFESINQAPPLNPSWNSLRAISKANILWSEETNGYGCNAIDYYEDLPWTIQDPNDAIACPPADAVNLGTKHSWMCDVAAAGHAAQWANELAALLLNLYTDTNTVLQIDGPLCDNVLNNVLRTTAATNSVPQSLTDSIYRAAWKQAFSILRQSFPKAMGNCADNEVAYAAGDLGYRFVEHWFRKYNNGWMKRTLGELQASIADMKAAGIRIMVGGLSGPGDVTDWFTSTGPGGAYGTWADIAAKVREVDAYDTFVVQSARATSGGYLYWQPEFTHPGG